MCPYLEAKLQQWAEENLGHVPAASGALEGIAVDGKVRAGSEPALRSSRQQGAEATHMLSALSHRLELTLGQRAVDDESNEIGAASDWLADLILEGRILTMDAQLTQRQIAQTIIDHQGDYVMIVKDNQPTLRAAM